VRYSLLPGCTVLVVLLVGTGRMEVGGTKVGSRWD